MYLMHRTDDFNLWTFEKKNIFIESNDEKYSDE